MTWHDMHLIFWNEIPWVLNYGMIATGNIELLKYTIKWETHMYQMNSLISYFPKHRILWTNF